ncbi:hypothetical protein FGSG_11933 [Fusarium graminearum PH-1]|uniref:hypothetical protein n=1 Tax=Gibberella zeae (strain ATCC MYA-4620 / CBS 123657 / FGSC 9075 / NRRL 31084 / PH-1) TaxID=229533 RepID=UPI00021F20E4|nr:hypothetical protein FGSG_11933 [Fusarium graminearum PH-1]ESU06643.1 hypothetical protein FGSG_11933 [Fusarium graminearum PH-1]|eukprot:XP_011317128.1 hypothetical protein FGSG_11933 [Fusarium graminearum PH-1]
MSAGGNKNFHLFFLFSGDGSGDSSGLSSNGGFFIISFRSSSVIELIDKEVLDFRKSLLLRLRLGFRLRLSFEFRFSRSCFGSLLSSLGSVLSKDNKSIVILLAKFAFLVFLGG